MTDRAPLDELLRALPGWAPTSSQSERDRRRRVLSKACDAVLRAPSLLGDPTPGLVAEFMSAANVGESAEFAATAAGADVPAALLLFDRLAVLAEHATAATLDAICAVGDVAAFRVASAVRRLPLLGRDSAVTAAAVRRIGQGLWDVLRLTGGSARSGGSGSGGGGAAAADAASRRLPPLDAPAAWAAAAHALWRFAALAAGGDAAFATAFPRPRNTGAGNSAPRDSADDAVADFLNASLSQGQLYSASVSAELDDGSFSRPGNGALTPRGQAAKAAHAREKAEKRAAEAAARRALVAQLLGQLAAQQRYVKRAFGASKRDDEVRLDAVAAARGALFRLAAALPPPPDATPTELARETAARRLAARGGAHAAAAADDSAFAVAARAVGEPGYKARDVDVARAAIGALAARGAATCDGAFAVANAALRLPGSSSGSGGAAGLGGSHATASGGMGPAGAGAGAGGSGSASGCGPFDPDVFASPPTKAEMKAAWQAGVPHPRRGVAVWEPGTAVALARLCCVVAARGIGVGVAADAASLALVAPGAVAAAHHLPVFEVSGAVVSARPDAAAAAAFLRTLGALLHHPTPALFVATAAEVTAAVATGPMALAEALWGAADKTIRSQAQTTHQATTEGEEETFLSHTAARLAVCAATGSARPPLALLEAMAARLLALEAHTADDDRGSAARRGKIACRWSGLESAAATAARFAMTQRPFVPQLAACGVRLQWTAALVRLAVLGPGGGGPAGAAATANALGLIEDVATFLAGRGRALLLDSAPDGTADATRRGTAAGTHAAACDASLPALLPQLIDALCAAAPRMAPAALYAAAAAATRLALTRCEVLATDEGGDGSAGGAAFAGANVVSGATAASFAAIRWLPASGGAAFSPEPHASAKRLVRFLDATVARLLRIPRLASSIATDDGGAGGLPFGATLAATAFVRSRLWDAESRTRESAASPHTRGAKNTATVVLWRDVLAAQIAEWTDATTQGLQGTASLVAATQALRRHVQELCSGCGDNARPLTSLL